MQKQIAFSKLKVAVLTFVALIFAVAVMAVSVGQGNSFNAYADSVSITMADASATYNSLEAVYSTSNIVVVGNVSDPIISYYNSDDVDMETAIAPIRAGEYIVKAECDGVFETAVFTIKPAVVNIELSGSFDPVYSGVPYTKTVTRTGVIQSDIDNGSFELVVSYVMDGTSEKLESATDAGLYNIDISLYNPTTKAVCTDYVIGTVSGGTSVNIQQKDLLIGVKSEIVNVGATPSFDFTYSGFLAGEDQDMLDKLPTVDFSETESGVYTVIPSGAEAKNYKISYKSGLVTINTASITIPCEGLEQDVVLKGDFNPTASISASDMTADEEYSKTIKSILDVNNAVNFATKVDKIIKITADSTANQGKYVKYTISDITSGMFAKTKIGVINANGEFQEVGNYTLKDGTLVMTANTLGSVVVCQDYTTALIILGAVVLFVLVVLAYFIATKLNYKKKLNQNKPKQSKYQEEKIEYKW